MQPQKPKRKNNTCVQCGEPIEDSTYSTCLDCEEKRIKRQHNDTLSDIHIDMERQKRDLIHEENQRYFDEIAQLRRDRIRKD